MAWIECVECGDDFRAPFKGMRSGTCSDCWKAARDAERQRAQERAVTDAEERGLPALEGSEAQVAWAFKIRAAHMSQIDLRMREDDEKAIEAATFLATISSAHWWIEHRSSDLKSLLLDALSMAKVAETRKIEREDKCAAAAIGEATLLPENATTTTVSEISVSGRAVRISFPEKIEEIRLMLRGRNFEWDSTEKVWKRETGSNKDRAAEMASLFLSMGVAVRIFDESIRSKVVDGSYEKEPRRVVTTYAEGHLDKLIVSWPRDDDFFSSFKVLRGAKYENGLMTVPVSSADDIIDWAERNDFVVNKFAEKRISEWRESMLGAKVVTPTVAAPKVGVVKSVPDRLTVAAAGIDPSLADA